MKNLIPVCMLILLISLTILGQGNAFSFQGRLNDGTNPANGRYDLTFRLFDAITGGNPLGQLVSKPNTVLVNGVFSITLDMGPGFTNPNNTFIEISVKPAGSPDASTTLGPRQQLTVVPFAVRSATATSADTATLSTTAANALSLGGFQAAEYPRLNVVNTGDLRTTGALAITGNASQPIAANGFVKAMIYVNANGTIQRCYNGITNATTGNCGFTSTHLSTGNFNINFGFRVADRFISVTTISASVNILTTVQFPSPSLPNEVNVTTTITDVDFGNSASDNPFMVIVY